MGKQRRPKDRLKQVTQRLDTLKPDPNLSAQENARVKAALEAFCQRLQTACPSASLSPEERLQRLVCGVNPEADMLEMATTKLARLQQRLDEVIPDKGLSLDQKLDRLFAMIDAEYPGDMSYEDKVKALVESRLPVGT